MDSAQQAADVQRVMDGDVDALQRLIVVHHRQLYRTVQNAFDPAMATRLDADDVLQAAYITAFESVGDCRFDGPGGFYRWLETIALSRLRDMQRGAHRQKRDVAREVSSSARPSVSYPGFFQQLAGADRSPSRHFAHDELMAAVMSSLARLTPEQRTVVQFRFLEGWSVDDVARHLGKSTASVHMLCHRGLKALRAQLSSLTSFLSQF